MGFLDFLNPIGSLIGGIGSIVGGITGNNQAQANNEASLALAREQMAMQKEFAQNGIQWKAADAAAAGVHPLFGLGASTPSFSPVSASFQNSDSSWMGNAGQNISRALSATATALDRKDELTRKTMETLQLNRAGLENELLAAQIRRTNGQVGPPFPALGQQSPGGGNSGDAIVGPTGTYDLKPTEVQTVNPANSGVTAGPAGGQVMYRLGGNGALQPFPPKDLGVEDEFGAPLMARWLLTQSYYRPPSNVWTAAFPGATDITWSTQHLGWRPVYGNNPSRADIMGSVHRAPRPGFRDKFDAIPSRSAPGSSLGSYVGR